MGRGRFSLLENVGSAGVKPGDWVTARQAATLGSTFGTTYSRSEKGHRAPEAATGADVTELPLLYPDGVLVMAKGEGVRIDNGGEVRSGPMRSILAKGINVVFKPMYPSDLQSLGFEDDFQRGESPVVADEVWIGKAYGEFAHFDLKPDGRWRSRYR